ncbi:HDOD domain-containing protein [Pseudodesulfovibrio sp.]|uniref:HDOD domain-containing protein n=1 Tax=Pseudodesulfovibrio sp. TaxID=2035812 RepID=UPI00263978C9|nr:HDOD domain-containing protein [Pseudodesulfovibrio sp.]MDD3312101.1 HDOD domain-containing protein [Pseudodesulfovibrio sp.]
MTRREAILSKVAEVVAIPSFAPKAAVLLNDPDSDLVQLARIIEYDPGLTANLLKIVNASFFSGRNPLLTARDAIDRLGSAQMLRFVVSTGVAPTFVCKVEGYDLAPNMHLQHSVTVALAARELGAVLGLDAPDHVFTAGLLSGVGKILLGAYVEVDVRPILDLVDRGMAFDRAEDEVLGVNHAEVGALLLEKWKLPQPLVNVVRHHLRPEEAPEPDLVLDLVHIGNVLAKMIGVGLGLDGLNYEPSREAAQRLKLTPEILDEVSANVVVDLRAVWDLFLECAGEASPL